LVTALDTSLRYALDCDRSDSLASFRERFEIADPELIYLDGNSLGRLPKGVAARLLQATEEGWGSNLIRGWNTGWWEAASRVGEMLGPLLGAAPGQVIVSDQTSLNLFKLASAALRLRPGRTGIVTDTLNFPSDLYVLQGIAELLGAGHQISRIGSTDDGITPDLQQLQRSVTSETALVTVSHVAFKSGYLYDMGAITDLAHQHGALVLWDLSHSAGALPISLDACDVDFAIGCTYKYLNGGPGAPAFLYVNLRLQEQARSPIWGWWGEATPFAFNLDYAPAAGVKRFLTGTAPILSLTAMEAALSPILEAGIETLRRKSLALTEYVIQLHDARLAPLGFRLGSPRDPARRGSHVSLRHTEGYRISRALIEEMKVIPDFRAPDSIRLGIAPLYVSFRDVWESIDRLCNLVRERRYETYPEQRATVT
jgi:kynureninase